MAERRSITYKNKPRGMLYIFVLAGSSFWHMGNSHAARKCISEESMLILRCYLDS